MDHLCKIQPLSLEDKESWLVLWNQYQVFYKVSIPEEVTEKNWERFHDSAEPLFALGAYSATGELIGIAHCVLHQSTWIPGLKCYLNDLFTSPSWRQRGIGRALIKAVKADAAERGCTEVYWLTHESNGTARALYDTLATNGGYIEYSSQLA